MGCLFRWVKGEGWRVTGAGAEVGDYGVCEGGFWRLEGAFGAGNLGAYMAVEVVNSAVLHFFFC